MIAHQRRFKADARSFAIARHLVENGHEVSLHVVSDQRKIGLSTYDDHGVRIVETPDLLWGRLRSGWDPWNLINRVAYLSRDTRVYDLVHCFETRPATIYPAMIYGKIHSLPILTDWNDWWGRGGIIDENRPKWYRLLFGSLETYYEEAYRNRAQGLTVISTALAHRAEALGVDHDRILHLPGGTLPGLFVDRSIEVCRRRIGLALSAPVVGFSSLDTHLDVNLILDALSHVASRHPDVVMIITGDAQKPVHDLVAELGLKSNVLFTGFVPLDELPWILGCADVFVLPFPDRIRNRGRWPNKIGDYMSLGRPTVTNPVGDIKGLFDSAEIGMFAEWDARDFSTKINFLIENPEIAARMGENARRLAVSTYSWEQLVEGLQDFYYEILETERQTAN